MRGRWLLLCAALGALACAPTSAPTDAPPVEMSLSEYAALCAERVAEIPPLDARLGAVIPVTVNGEVPERYEPGMPCDRPTLVADLGCDGQCVPYSRLQLLRDDGEAQIVAMFRRLVIRDEDDPLFDEIDLIAHNVRTGETCWFRATAENPHCDPAVGLDGTAVPAPGPPGADAFWRSPREVVAARCASCHDNDPFYYSPYVAQVADHLPANPLGKYTNALGPFRAWPPLESLDSRGNTCTGCHRIGTRDTSGDGLLLSIGAKHAEQASEWARSYPGSHWMPAHNPLTERQWSAVYEESARRLHAWHLRGVEADLELQPIPGNPPEATR